jgi:hypothetical protein
MDSALTTKMTYIDSALRELSGSATRIANMKDGEGAQDEADQAIRRVLALVSVANNVVGTDLRAFESFSGTSSIDRAMEKLQDWIDAIRKLLVSLVHKSRATGFSIAAGGSLMCLIPTITVCWEQHRPQRSVLDEASYVRTIR